MKRRDAFSKIRLVCERLDQDYPNPEPMFRVTPLRMWLFGSVLTDKPAPDDIDLLLFVDDHRELYTDQDFSNLIHDMSYSRPLPIVRAAMRWRKGMKKVNIIPYESTHFEDAETFFHHFHLDDVNPRLVWQPGLDWHSILQQIEQNPRPWDPELEAQHKEALRKMDAERRGSETA